MEEFSVPIDYSNLKDCLPPNEEIVYSTFCNISYSIKYISDIKKTHGTPKMKTYMPPIRTVRTKRKFSYKSHLLITTKGLAYSYQPIQRVIDHTHVLSLGEVLQIEGLQPYPIRPSYNTLLNTKSFVEGGFSIVHSDASNISPIDFKIKLLQNPKFESEDNFIKRRKKFLLFLIPQVLRETQSILDYVQENKKREQKYDPPLWQVDKSLLSPHNDIEFFNRVNNYINTEYEKVFAKPKLESLFLDGTIINLVGDILAKPDVAYIKRQFSKEEQKIISRLTLYSAFYGNGIHSSLLSSSYEKYLKYSIQQKQRMLKTLNKKYLKWESKHHS
ncbi:MAG: hypothetical protein ACFE9S_16215 [Candidatus Hermodarchaeota archaeon]